MYDIRNRRAREHGNTYHQALRPRRTALRLAAAVLVVCTGSGCAVSQAIGPVAASPDGQATLLIAASDGTVASHNASVDADVCLRSIPLQMTVCYAKGSPRLDPVTHEVTGHEMVMTLLDTR